MIHTERLPRSRLADFSWEHPCTSMVPRASTSKPAFHTGGRLRQAMADFAEDLDAGKRVPVARFNATPGIPSNLASPERDRGQPRYRNGYSEIRPRAGSAGVTGTNRRNR